MNRPNWQRLQRRTIGHLSSLRPAFGYWLKVRPTLETKMHLSQTNPSSETLFILLPGIADQHFDFEMAGFIAKAEELGLEGDLIAVDAHIGYYMRENILNRLRDDVVIPARMQGYQKIWLVGTSLGALGSALYSIQHGGDIDGVFLIAPFLGDKALIQSIHSVGGLRNWQSSIETVDVAPYQIALWDGLKRQLYSNSPSIPVYLGFGHQDRFADAHQLLADSLPARNIFVERGGHDWKTWSRLWQHFIEHIKAEKNGKRST